MLHRQVFLRSNSRHLKCFMREMSSILNMPIRTVSMEFNGTRGTLRTGNSAITLYKQDSKKHGWRGYQLRAIFPTLLLLAASLKDEDREVLTPNEDIEALLIKAQQFIARGSKEKAEQTYLDALHLVIERKDKSMVAHIQDILASIALRSGDHEKALQLLKHVIKNLIGTGMKENDLTILEISLKLATLYATSQNHDTAITGYEWVIEKARENLRNVETPEERENHLAFLGMSLDSYGRYLFMLKKTKHALHVTKEAIEISTKLFGQNDIRTLVLLNDYGAILMDLGEFDEAEQTIEKAIQNSKTCNDAKHSDIAVFWVNLGSIYLKHKKSQKANDAFKKAKKEAVLSKNRSLQLQVDHYIDELTD